MLDVSTHPLRRTRLSRVSAAFADHPSVGWVIVGWACINLIVGSLQLREGLYLSQPLLILLIGYLGALRLSERRPLGVPQVAFALLVAIVLPLIAGGTGNDRFVPEQLKMLMLIAGGAAISQYIKWEHVPPLARFLPPILCLLILGVLATGTGFYYGDERFGVPTLGSPNTTAFVIVNALALRFHLVDLRSKVGLIDVVTIGILMVALIATDSDGGRVSFLFLLARYCRIPMRLLVFGTIGVILAAVLFIFLFSIKVPELLGSGRLQIWETLTSSLLSSGWTHLLFGFGPGAIDLTPDFTIAVRSAHSMFGEVTYAYGLVGLVALVFVVVRIGARIHGAMLGPKQRRFLEGLFVALLAGAFVDTYFVAAQIVWIGALVLALFGLVDPRRQVTTNLSSAALARLSAARRPA